jgi:hypothetical protein
MKKLLEKVLFGSDFRVFVTLLSWVSIHCYLFQRVLDAIK